MSKQVATGSARQPAARKATKAKAPAPRTTKATDAELIADGKLEIGAKLTATY